jgi:hypothetical protein
VADATAVHNLIKGSTTDGNGQFTVPCDFNQVVSLTFGGKAFDIDPKDIAIQGQAGATDCLSGISGGNFGTSDTEWLVCLSLLFLAKSNCSPLGWRCIHQERVLQY